MEATCVKPRASPLSLAIIKMDEKIIEILKEFGLALVEKQHQFFVDEGIDNSEHIPAIKRIASIKYQQNIYIKSCVQS